MVSKPTYDELEQRMQKCTDMLAKTTDKLERETEDCRLVEEVLRDREARARALLNAPTESALLIDSEGVIIALNETAHKRLGKSSDKLVGANVYDLVSPDVGKARKAQADKVIRSGEPVRFEDERQGRWFDQSIYPVFSAHGEVYQLALFAHDITDRKLAQEELEKSHQELGRRVEDRTSELTKANEQLNCEIKEHKRTEEALQVSEAELRRLSSRLLEVQENERKRIAGELHDSIGQSLTAIKFGLENALDRISRHGANESLELLETLIPVAQQASEEVRQIHTNLRPSLLDDLGIISTISWFCREFKIVYSNVRIEKRIGIEERNVPENLKIVIFRVLQEAMNNISKHGKADFVRISFKEKNGRLELLVEDNGRGFDVEHIRSMKTLKEGFGLTSMRERTELSGGSFAVESTPGAGTVVRALWPM